MISIPSVQPVMMGFVDDESCRKWLIDHLHPDGPACPVCGYAPRGRSRVSFYAGRRVRCYGCGKFYHGWTDTILSGAHMTPAELVMMFFLIECGVDPKVIGPVIDRTPDIVRLWKKKLTVVGTN